MLKKLLAIGVSLIAFLIISTNTATAEEPISIEEPDTSVIVPYQSITVSNIEYHTTFPDPGSFPDRWNTSVVGNNGVIYYGTLRLQRIERINGNFRGYYSGTLYNRPGTLSSKN